MDTSERDRLLQELQKSGHLSGHGIIDLFPTLPFEVSIPIPFASLSLHIGGSNLAKRRKDALRRPTDADSRISLGALLLSQEPVTREFAREAKDELEAALRLLPEAGAPNEIHAQTRAMVHKFLGDALLELDELPEARIQWEHALALDPVRPPWGFSGPALEQLDKHPVQ